MGTWNLKLYSVSFLLRNVALQAGESGDVYRTMIIIYIAIAMLCVRRGGQPERPNPLIPVAQIT